MRGARAAVPIVRPGTAPGPAGLRAACARRRAAGGRGRAGPRQGTAGGAPRRPQQRPAVRGDPGPAAERPSPPARQRGAGPGPGTAPGGPRVPVPPRDGTRRGSSWAWASDGPRRARRKLFCAWSAACAARGAGRIGAFPLKIQSSQSPCGYFPALNPHTFARFCAGAGAAEAPRREPPVTHRRSFSGAARGSTTFYFTLKNTSGSRTSPASPITPPSPDPSPPP